MLRIKIFLIKREEACYYFNGFIKMTRPEGGKEGGIDQSQFFLSIEKALSSLGIKVFFPQREGGENDRTTLTAGEAYEQAKELIEEANLVVWHANYLSEDFDFLGLIIGMAVEAEVPVVILGREEFFDKVRKNPLKKALLGSEMVVEIPCDEGENGLEAIKELVKIIEENPVFFRLS